MRDDLITRYAAPVPRYTSYPTAPHFHPEITAQTYARWLGEVTSGATISLYIHVPYCDRLCWFCGCHTKHTLRYEPITSYLDALYAEIDWVSEKLAGNGIVSAIHLGGGSPTMLTADDMAKLKARLAASFQIADDVEISIEIDPNDLGEDRFDAMASFGLTRASVGVQDFDPRVQQAIKSQTTGDYQKAALAGIGATSRGFALTSADRLHGYAIEALLCRFALRRDELRQFGPVGQSLFNSACAIAAQDQDGMTTADTECFAITERGRPFVRTIAAKFVAYLGKGAARHSLAV